MKQPVMPMYYFFTPVPSVYQRQIEACSFAAASLA
jgi:hypothetical protein